MLITTPPKKSTSFDLSIFLFKPQAWYVITRQRVWYRRRRMESPKVHFLRLDSIPSCNGFHTMLCIDSIHASRRDVGHEFKSIRKLLKISFLLARVRWRVLFCASKGVRKLHRNLAKANTCVRAHKTNKAPYK